MVDALSSSNGAPLPEPAAWSKRVGADVSDAHIVTGDVAARAADSIDARAFTVGNRVFFGSGNDPSTDGGDLLAHELTHVAQQRGSSAPDSWDELPLVAQHDSREAEAKSQDGRVTSGGGHAIARDVNGGTAKPTSLAFIKAATTRGTLVVEVKVEVARLPVELATALHAAEVTVAAGLYIDGGEVAVAIRIGPAVWIAVVNAKELVDQLIGTLGARALALLGKIEDFIASWTAKSRLRPVGGSRVRIDLWNQNGTPSFVVVDVASAISGVQNHSLRGFRPVEAQLDVGSAAGAAVFGGDQVKGAVVVPTEPPVGGEWFDIADGDGSVKSIYGGAGKSPVRGAVFYAHGTLTVAVKPTDDAQTGAVAHVSLAELLEKLKRIGGKALAFIDKIVDRVKSGASNLLKVVKGMLSFELPELGTGSWLQFDLHLQLPRLLHGGHFDLSALWPTSFHFSLPHVSFGALPKLSIPWLKSPRLGGFSVPWERIKALLGELPGIPKLPSIDLELHFIHDLHLGLAIDLSKLWPDFAGGDACLTFEIDLAVLLDKVAGAGKYVADKLHGTTSWLLRWAHLGGDGVLRLYDDRDPNSAMIGFHLARLLDGVNATDLAPTEMRWNASKQFDLEVGEQAKPGATRSNPRKASPTKPAGDPLRIKTTAPQELAQLLALKAGAPVEIDVFASPKASQVTLWAESPSAVYDNGEAAKVVVGYGAIVEAVLKRLPNAGKLTKARLPVRLLPIVGDMIEFEFGDAARDPGDKVEASGVGGRVGWKVSRLISASHAIDIIPDLLDTSIKGTATVQLGPIHPTGASLGPEFAVAWPAARKDLLHAADGTDVHVSAYSNGEVISLAMTKEPNGKEGALAEVSLTFLLRQLERLGKLGEKALELLAKAAKVALNATASFAERVAQLAAKIGRHLFSLVDGKISITFIDRVRIDWDLKLHLPHIGLNFDWSKLVPDIDITFRDPGIGISWLPRPHFDLHGIRLPKIPRIPVDWLIKLVDSLPGFDLSKLPKLDVEFIIEWIDSDFELGLWIDVSDLLHAFTDLFPGKRYFGLRIPLGKLVDKIKRLGEWVRKHLSGSKNSGSVLDAFDMGPDGVLRIHDPNSKNIIGFDLRKLLDGVDPSDLVPVEIRTELDNKGESLIDLSYGDSKTSDKNKELAKDHHKVLAPSPTAPWQFHARVATKAPSTVQEYLGVSERAQIEASLFLLDDKDKKQDAMVFAHVPPNDRGLAVTVHYAKLAAIAENVGPIHAPGGLSLHIERDLSTKGMLYATFGPQPKANEKLPPNTNSGRIGWKLEHLLGGEFSPDELHVANDKGALTAGSAISLTTFTKVTDFDVPSWGQSVIGSNKGEVWTNTSSGFRVALVEANAKSKTTARGIEVDLEEKFIHKVEDRLATLVIKAQQGIGHALRRTRDAAANLTKSKHKVHPRVSTLGVMVERGKASEPDYMYATFSWDQLGRVAAGEFSIDSLMPIEFRVATKRASLELKNESKGDSVGKNPPDGSHRIGSLHELFRGPLTAIGLLDKQWLRIDASNSHVTTNDKDDQDHQIALVADVYDVNTDSGDRAKVSVTGDHQVRATISLEAVIAQVIPKARKLLKKKDRSATKKPSRIYGSLTLEDPGIKLTAGADISSSRTQRSLEISVGWTLDQVLELLMRMGDVIDDDGKSKGSALGLLAPSYLVGKYQSEKFAIEFGTVSDPRASDHNCMAKSIPGMVEILSEVLDEGTARASKLHFELPGKTELLKRFKDAVLNGTNIKLATCAVEVPQEKKSKFYGLSFSLTPEIFLTLASFIPEIGLVIKLAQAGADFLKHPGETLENLAYTPEMLYHFVHNFGDIVQNFKSMSWKDVAVGLMFSNDMNNKQAVMAARLYEKLKSDPKVWERVKAMKDKGEFSDISGIPATYLRWLAEQDENTLAEFFKYGKILKDQGIDVPEKDFTVPDHDLNVDVVKSKIDLIEHEYQDLSQEMDAAEKAKKEGKKVDEAHLAAHAKAIQMTIAAYTGAGAKPVTVSDPRKADPNAKAPEVKKPEHDLTNVSGMPDPDEDQAKQAQQIYKRDSSGNGSALRVEVDYMVKKYGGLSTDQLGDLLTSGKTMVKTRNGEVELPMFEDERDFVRSLFLLRVDPHAQLLAPGQAVKPKLTDAELVSRWKAGSFAGKGVQPGQDTPTNATPKGSGATKNGKGAAQGSGGGGPAGDAGTYQDGEGDIDAQETDDILGDEKDIAAGGGNSSADDADDDDDHLVNLTQQQAMALVFFDTKSGSMKLQPDAEKWWLSVYPTNSAGQHLHVHSLKLVDKGKQGDGDDATYLFRLEWEFWTVKADKTEDAFDHREVKVLSYSPKSKSVSQRHQDADLIAEVRKQLKVVKGKAVVDAGLVKTSQITLKIDDVAESQLLDPHTGMWGVTLWIRVNSATTGYMLFDENNHPFDASDFTGKPKLIKMILPLATLTDYQP